MNFRWEYSLKLPTKKQWQGWTYPSKASVMGTYITFIALVFAVFAYFYPWSEFSVDSDQAAINVSKSIEIPVRIYNGLGAEAWVEQEAEFYILKPETPLMDVTVYNGMTRILRPENITTINDRYPVPQHDEINTKILLPQDSLLTNYIKHGGYKLRLVVRLSWSDRYFGYGEIMLDEYGIKKGINVKFDYENTPNKKVQPTQKTRD